MTRCVPRQCGSTIIKNQNGSEALINALAVLGTYSLATARANGDVISNGSINITGSGSINGDAHPGIGKSVYLSGGGTVTGSTTPLKTTLSYSMATLPTSYQSVGYINLTSGSFIGGASGVTTNYYCTGLSISNSAYINCIGPVKIYCSGSININGGWFNIAMQMEVLETKPEVRSSSLASLDFLHYQFDYPLTGMRELILETLKNGFFTLGAAGSGTNEPFEERLAAWNQWNSQLQLRSLRQKNLQIHTQRHIHLRLRRR